MQVIKIVSRRRHASWTRAELSQLGNVPDSVLARRTERTIKEVVAMRQSRRLALPTPPRRWTAREIRLLCTLPDLEVARRLRRPHCSVRDQRTRLRIPIFNPARNSASGNPPRSTC